MRTYIMLGFLIRLVLSGQQKSLSLAKVTKVECIPNDDWLKDVECSLKPLRNRSIQMQAKFFIKMPMNAVKMRFEVFRWYSGFRPYLIDFSVDFCALLAQRKKMNVLTKPFYSLIIHYSTLNHSCPFEGLIEIPPVVPDLSVFPSMIVTGTYLLVITMVDASVNQRVITFKVKAEVTSDIHE